MVKLKAFSLPFHLIGVVKTRLCFADWSSTDCVVLLIGPVQNVLFCFFVWYTTLCFAYWSGTKRFVLLNGPFPKFETASSQAGNHRLPLQGTAGSQRLELFVPNLETPRYHCKELPVPRDWNSWFPTSEP